MLQVKVAKRPGKVLTRRRFFAHRCNKALVRRRCDSRANVRAGFTLLEILISIVILSVGILGATAMQSASLNGEVLARNIGSGTNIAADALDRIQANSENISDYMGGSYAGAFTVSPDPTKTGARPSADGAGFDYDEILTQMQNMGLDIATLSVIFQADTPISGVDTATAIVSWPHKGGTKQCQIIQIITKN